MAPAASAASMVNETSNLYKITVSSSDPMDLFSEWFQEAKDFNMPLPNRVCISSSSSTGHVTSRSLLMRQLEDDGFVIMTDKRSLKAKQWEDNPRAAFTFFWGYWKDEHVVAKQVRAEGSIEELSPSEYVHLYDKEPLYCKIRSYICNQGQKVEWDELKAAHDELLQNVKSGATTLPMPDHVIMYKLHPTMMEFYSADEVSIGDRIVFTREEGASSWKGSWKHHHIAA